MSGPGICTLYVGSIEFNIICFLHGLIAAVLTESHELVFLSHVERLINVLWLSCHVTLTLAHLFHRLVHQGALITLDYGLIHAYLSL